ncbi:MAG: hypothetical protein VW835_15285, partial [Rickettsiales bacterium]
MTTLPVIYRGIWADEFALFSFPLLIACLWISVKQRRWDIVLVLSPGLFNLIFYALISYNIPRYQTTAAPDLSLALAVGVMALLAYLGHQPNAGPLPGAHPNRHPSRTLSAICVLSTRCSNLRNPGIGKKYNYISTQSTQR